MKICCGSAEHDKCVHGSRLVLEGFVHIPVKLLADPELRRRGDDDNEEMTEGKAGNKVAVDNGKQERNMRRDHRDKKHRKSKGEAPLKTGVPFLDLLGASE